MYVTMLCLAIAYVIHHAIMQHARTLIAKQADLITQQRTLIDLYRKRLGETSTPINIDPIKVVRAILTGAGAHRFN